MHKRKNTNNALQDNSKISSLKSADAIASADRNKQLSLGRFAPAGVLTFSFRAISFTEVGDQLEGGA